jgi:hypothetical protein
MNEQLVSLDTARLAKEKGFNWDVFDYYYDGKLKRWSPSTRNANKFGVPFSAPQQSLLQKWLRNVHGWHIRISINLGDYYFDVESVMGTTYLKNQCEIGYKSYEEALEEGLLYSLKLL